MKTRKIRYIYSKIAINAVYGKILKNGEAILNKNDIKNLVKRMTNIKKLLPNDWETKMYNEYVKATNELKDLCDKNLPTMARFFFGSTTYDYCYFNSVINIFLPWLKERMEASWLVLMVMVYI